MKRLQFILLGLILGLSAALSQSPQNTVKTESGANDPTAHAYLAKTVKALSASANMEIRFNACSATPQTLKNPINCQRGSLLANGEKFRLILGTQTYYCDTKSVWVYTPENKEAAVYNYSEEFAQANPFFIIRNYKKFYRAKYIRQENLGGGARNLIDLTPLNPSEILKIRLYLNNSDNLPYRMELYYGQENIYVYLINECKAVSKTEAADFTFDPARHPGVSVNDMR